MAENKHAPGPWTFKVGPDYDDEPGDLEVRASDGRLVVIVGTGDEGEAIGNAHLIAMAPEMAEALRYALNKMKAMRGDFNALHRDSTTSTAGIKYDTAILVVESVVNRVARPALDELAGS